LQKHEVIRMATNYKPVIISQYSGSYKHRLTNRSINPPRKRYSVQVTKTANKNNAHNLLDYFDNKTNLRASAEKLLAISKNVNNNNKNIPV